VFVSPQVRLIQKEFKCGESKEMRRGGDKG
jgi:hypothetical protein